MSFNDIKDGYSDCIIAGKKFKIAYDNAAIAQLEDLYDSSFFYLNDFIEDLKTKKLAEILKFCYIGFLKYQPDFDKSILDNYSHYGELYIKCVLEFTRSIKLPDEYERMVDEGRANEAITDNVKKKQLGRLKFLSIITKLRLI